MVAERNCGEDKINYVQSGYLDKSYSYIVTAFLNETTISNIHLSYFDITLSEYYPTRALPTRFLPTRALPVSSLPVPYPCPPYPCPTRVLPTRVLSVSSLPVSIPCPPYQCPLYPCLCVVA